MGTRSRGNGLSARGVRPRGPAYAPQGAGLATARPEGVIRRRKRNFPHEALQRGPAVWRAAVPEAVKPFLTLRDAALRCPTCNARQLPSVQCRRCKCDLSLVVAVHDQQRRLHARILRQLAAGCYTQAVASARHRWALSPDPPAARLLTVCYLLLGRFRVAQDVRAKVP